MSTAPLEWNSLEVAKLIVAFLTPVLLFFLSWRVTKAARRVEEAQWAGRKLIERRLELHQELAPWLNDLVCFYTWKGHFRTIDPPRVIEIKRNLDRTFFANEQLFSKEFATLYRSFIGLCFAQSGHKGKDARLQTSRTTLKDERGDAPWNDAWNELFVWEPEILEERLEERLEKERLEAAAKLRGPLEEQRPGKEPPEKQPLVKEPQEEKRKAEEEEKARKNVYLRIDRQVKAYNRLMDFFADELGVREPKRSRWRSFIKSLGAMLRRQQRGSPDTRPP